MAKVRGGPQTDGFLASAFDQDRFGRRDCGDTVTEHRSSWVRRLRTEAGDFHVKTYDYPTWRDRWRGVWRWTGPFVRSRAAREFDALVWLRRHSPDAVEPVAAFEDRRHGLLRRAVLVTRTFAGERLDRLLQAAEDRAALAAALARFVTEVHDRGFRDGNLDLRNLLGRRADDGTWRIAKIDSPRYRLAGRPGDARAAADWARLLPQLEPFGVADLVRAAARPAS